MEPDLDIAADRHSDVPLGAQLAARVRALVETGRLRPGARLPSVRALAAQVGVNVNTVRAVYGRLESEGVVVSEQGRGTFVAERAAATSERRELRRQIERLEAELVRLPAPPPDPGATAPAARRGAGLLSTDELAAVRDELLDRLRDLDAARVEVIQRLERLELGEPAREPVRRSSSSSLPAARIRWVGA
jgi:DNA-binding transcriptional regulator YhcF (GntR family)